MNVIPHDNVTRTLKRATSSISENKPETTSSNVNAKEAKVRLTQVLGFKQAAWLARLTAQNQDRLFNSELAQLPSSSKWLGKFKLGLIRNWQFKFNSGWMSFPPEKVLKLPRSSFSTFAHLKMESDSYYMTGWCPLLTRERERERENAYLCLGAKIGASITIRANKSEADKTDFCIFSFFFNRWQPPFRQTAITANYATKKPRFQWKILTHTSSPATSETLSRLEKSQKLQKERESLSGDKKIGESSNI